MIGIYPSNKNTFYVMGPIGTTELKDKCLYFDNNNRLFMYSTTEKRSNPNTGFFPVFDGKNYYIDKFSIVRKYPNDIVCIDINKMIKSITDDVANNVRYQHRICLNNEKLKPQINDTDSMFTQCIKSIICNMDVNIIDLIDNACGKLTDDDIEKYYTSLNRISFMRNSKWKIWIDTILKIEYKISIYKNDELILEYDYPSEDKHDPFKTIIKTLIEQLKIDKQQLFCNEMEDYAINNLYAALRTRSELSSQLFSRFMNLSKLKYRIDFYKNKQLIFQYNEVI